jgi:hypothetical protein
MTNVTHRTPLLAATIVAVLASLACARQQKMREPSPCDVPGVAETRDTVPVVREGASAGQVVIRARRQGSPEAVGRTRARLTGTGTALENATLAGDVLISNVPAGRHELTVAAPKFRPRTTNFETREGAGVEIDFPLAPDCPRG